MNDGQDTTVGASNDREQRLLAAIVFTDVVGFSRLAAKNEARIYGALQRDMGVMTNLCRAHGGHLLNTMGDAMLMSFPSAVDAMACAVEIQRTLASQNMSLPPTDTLHHRIGVHLGDVIVKGDNVFGDGVNTAARLQTDARPDSIWYSHTVHEVIKNKLKFDSRYVGQRQFKNLGEPIKVWEVPPVAEVRAKLQADAGGLIPTEAPNEGVRGLKAGVMILCSAALIAIVVFIVSRMKATEIKDGPPRPTPDWAQKLKDRNKPAVATNPNPPAASGPSFDQMRSTIAAYQKAYSFAELATYLQGDGKNYPDAPAMAQKYGKLAQLRSWVDGEIQKSSPSDMIQVHLTEGESNLYGSSGGPQVGNSVAGYHPLDYLALSPADFLAIIDGVGSWPSAQKPAEFDEWRNLFASEYANGKTGE